MDNVGAFEHGYSWMVDFCRIIIRMFQKYIFKKNVYTITSKPITCMRFIKYLTKRENGL